MSYPKSIELQQALDIIHSVAGQHTLGTETVALNRAHRRVLANDVVAQQDVPGADCSRMDGFAINLGRLHRNNDSDKAGYTVPLKPAVHASRQTSSAVCGDHAIPIMTGAVMPTDADAVVLKEHVVEEAGHIHFSQRPPEGVFIRLAGSDISAGDVVLSQFQKLNPGHLGVLASLGLPAVKVLKQPKVSLMMSGDELVVPGQPLAMGQSYDASSAMLQSVLTAMGCDWDWHQAVGDDINDIRAQFESLKNQGHDVIITSGGVSMGDKDFLPEMLAEQGEIYFHKVLLRPGFPVLCGRLGSALFFGLPGNPVSAYTTLCQLVHPALNSMSHQSTDLLLLQAALTAGLEKNHQRVEFMRGHYTSSADGLQVSVCGGQQSSRLASVAEANCFIQLSAASQSLQSGDYVMIQPLFQFHD